MPPKKQPKGRIKSFFASKKRSRPSTGSSQESGGAVSQVTKSAKMASPSMKDLQKDLLKEFDDVSESEDEMLLDTLDKTMDVCFREFKEKIRAQLKKVINCENERKTRSDGGTDTTDGTKRSSQRLQCTGNAKCKT